MARKKSGAGRQLRFELPVSAVLPRLATVDHGLRNLVARGGHDGAYTMAVTLLDTPDHRLLRSGVRLAHRVVDGQGDWYLAAPGWAPDLPERRILELDVEGDLPAEFAELITPFRRTAAIGPVAALDAERREFWLRSGDGRTVGTLIDERVTVRRGGLTVSRYAEVTVTDDGLDQAQRDWITAQLVAAGATPTEEFPRLELRLGAPATGRTDFPDGDLAEPSFGGFVAAVLARRLQAMVRGHLAGPAATSKLLTQTRRLRRELQALTPVLERRWAEDLLDDLAWLIGAPTDKPADSDDRVLRGDRYLMVLEALVSAIRLPRVAETAAMPTTEVTQSLVDEALGDVRAQASAIVPTSPIATWQAARDAADQLLSVCQVTAPVLGRKVQKLGKRATRLRSRLDQCLDDRRVELRHRAEVDPASAFDLGRDYERESMRVQQVHEEFVADWPRLARKLS